MQIKILVTGDEELNREIEAIAAEDGPKSINAAMRKFCREAVNLIVKPLVIQLIPYDDDDRNGDGVHLRDAVVVRATKRSRKGIGFYVGFEDELFQGPTFYGGFIEFGWTHPTSGTVIQADSFLREALYPQEGAIRAYIATRMEEWIAERNRTTPEKGLDGQVPF